jgi:hypothetical protein
MFPHPGTQPLEPSPDVTISIAAAHIMAKRIGNEIPRTDLKHIRIHELTFDIHFDDTRENKAPHLT